MKAKEGCPTDGFLLHGMCSLCTAITYFMLSVLKHVVVGQTNVHTGV